MTDLHQKTSASRLIASSPFFSSLSRSFYLLSSRSCFVAPLPLPRDPSSLDPSRLLSYRPKSLRKLATRIESSRVEGTGERECERVEEEKGSGGEWRRGRGRGGKGVKIPRRSGWSFERTERFDFINESNNRTMVYRFSSFDPFSISFFFSSFLFPLAPKPSPIYDAPRALVDISPDRLKNHYRETISWEGGARGTRGKYLDGFNRGSFKSQRREPPVHRACLSSETSEGDKIDRRPLPFIPRSARNYEGFARPKSSMLDAFFISRANAREIDGDRGVRATAIYFTLYFKV